MNYYEHHLGDYAAATAHLSWDEDMAYQRLMRAYYRTEKPIPADIKAACRLVRADSRSQRDAVASVLREFFELLDDGWHQRRCDAEITRYRDKQAKASRSANARWATKPTHSEGNANASTDAMRTHSEGNAPRHQTPDTRETKDQREHIRGVCACALVEVRKSFPQADESADLLALVEQGATPGEIGAIAAEAATKGKGWPWVVTTVVGRRQDAAKLALAPKPEPPWHETRSGIVAKGVELGVGEWSEAEWHAGRAPQWPTYQAKVYAAAGYEPPRMSA